MQKYFSELKKAFLNTKIYIFEFKKAYSLFERAPAAFLLQLHKKISCAPRQAKEYSFRPFTIGWPGGGGL